MYFIAIRTRRYTHTQTLNAVSAASRYVRTDKWVFRCVSERVWMLWTGVMATTRITHTDFNRLAAGWKMAKTFFGFMFSNQMIILSLDNQCTCTYLIVPYRFLCVSHSHARSIEPKPDVCRYKTNKRDSLCQIRNGSGSGSDSLGAYK